MTMRLFDLRIDVRGDFPGNDSEFEKLADEWTENVSYIVDDLVHQFAEKHGFTWESR